jgi:hypothetical protein
LYLDAGPPHILGTYHVIPNSHNPCTF